MVIRIEYPNGDWDLLEFDGTFYDIEENFRQGFAYLKGKISGMETLVRIDALRCIREWKP